MVWQKASKNSQEDIQSHTLVIENEDGDWYIEHLPNCPKEDATPGGMADYDQDKMEPLEYHTCRVQAVIDGNGIDDIENWRELEPGRYEIRSYYEYHPGEYGGTTDAEHEIGIFLVDDASHR